MHSRALIWIAAGAGSLAVLAAVAAGPLSSRVEQPVYKVLKSDGAIEVRAYEPSIAAEVALKGNRTAALSDGFRIIAGYIFGANRPNAKIAMTAPVSQQADDGAWQIRFIMPRGWSMETLPTPTDPRVKLTPTRAETFLAIRFSGAASDRLIRSKTDELRRYATDHRIATIGEPLIAFYNPPWTLPFLRRNEVMLQVDRSPG